MAEFKWQPAFSIGDPSLDAQHQALFELANELAASVTDGELKRHVMQLYKHVREHFREEESFMAEVDYPAYLNHVGMHDLMLAKLVRLSEEINRGEWSADHLAHFMQTWIGHIREADMQVKEYLNLSKKTS